MSREFDPDAAKTIHAELVHVIEKLELKQEMVGRGDLSYAPAFGLVLSGQSTAQTNYKQLHYTAWNNLDTTRRGMYAALSWLEMVMKQHGITEYENVRELDALKEATEGE
ncbi:hypothetical protein [Natronoglycomyces albus]|uniref:Uncharacterized protein n=1 Tax=Natronoglycomyces albus TaxID=2811108 RepID=A0A895XUF2_9ACTN|nr:hypothetical protein [Natronoglycomyces albus]QSB05288.1 hypothetical protein JQS30_16295 [Natronoglycomyces albus]